jgi:hypothetical protein
VFSNCSVTVNVICPELAQSLIDVRTAVNYFKNYTTNIYKNKTKRFLGVKCGREDLFDYKRHLLANVCRKVVGWT